MFSTSKVLLVLMGLVAFSHAAGYVRARVAPVPVKSYGQPLAALKTEAVVTAAPEPELEEEEVSEVEPETYKAAVRTVDRSPIRVSYAKQPERDSYVSSNSGYDARAARLENEKLNEEQNKNAQYSFGAAIDDGINDMSQVRQESRDGLRVEGSYSYSDGFYKHTVKYEADENGYRVVENTKEQIGDGSGPIVDPVNGKADVHTSNQGVDMTYSVSAKELEDFSKERLATAGDLKSKVKGQGIRKPEDSSY